MKDKYTISEIARFFHVSSQTLRYYDKIGLYKPAIVDKENGYRYYRYEQFFTLSLIIQLKQLNFSLEDIRKYIQTKEVCYLEEILEKEQKIIEKQLAELENLRRDNQKLLGKIQLSKNVNESFRIEWKEEPERYTYQIPINFEIKNLYQYIKLLYDSYLREFPGSAGAEHKEVVLQIRRRNLEQKKFKLYNSIGIFLNPGCIEPLYEYHKIPAGQYVTGYHMGTYDTIHRTYERLYEYIKKQGCRIVGDSLEFAIISIALTDKKEDFITEIQIPVAEKENATVRNDA